MYRFMLFFRRCIAAVSMGLVAGLAGIAFHHAIHGATLLRLSHPFLLLLLPVGGLLTALLYRIFGMEDDGGTNLALAAVRDHAPMRLRTAPLIFVTTVLNHLVGGSSGREGAALQLGGSLASRLGHALGLAPTEGRMLTACGMSAAFSALFGTPVTAALFSLEVAHVGLFSYATLLPALLSAVTGVLLAGSMGIEPTFYPISSFPAVNPLSLLQVALLGISCAGAAILFCSAMHLSHKLYDRYFPNPLLRAVVGGGLVLGLTVLVGLAHGDPLGFPIYNGAGGELVETAILNGNAQWYDFLLKLLFTALTLGAGFRGGEIVPAFAVGSTLGCTLAPLLGLPPSFGGAVGLIGLFCGVTNCPMASILLAFELFGGGGLPLFALTAAVSYFLSGDGSLYSTQKLLTSKIEK